MRVSRWVVRPGRKNGGTVVVFKLAREAVVRFTVVRVYPTCKLMGSFRVRAQAGVNRVPFRGRVRGRALPAGTYRLLLRVEGAKEDAAAVTIVVVRGKASPRNLRKARRSAVCGATDTARNASPTSFHPPVGGSNAGDSSKDRIAGPLVGAAKAVVKKAKALSSRFKKSVDDPAPVGALFLIAVGLLTLASAALGALAVLKLTRLTEFGDRFYR